MDPIHEGSHAAFRLQMPLDLNPILFNYTLDYKEGDDHPLNPEGDMTDQAFQTLPALFISQNWAQGITDPPIIQHVHDNLQMVPYIRHGELSYKFLADTTQARSYVAMNGQVFLCTGFLGGGTYGKVARVRGPNGKEYALKRQWAGNNAQYVQYIREGIMNYLVHSQNTECKYGNKLYGIGAAYTESVKLQYEMRYSEQDTQGHVQEKIYPPETTVIQQGYFCYHLTELMDGTLDSILSQLTRKNRSIEVTRCLSHVGTALDDLGAICRFNHKDFKPDNVLYVNIPGNKRVYYLTDFGFSECSLLDRDGDIVSFSSKNFENFAIIDKTNPSRDITQMVWYILYIYSEYKADFLEDSLKANLSAFLQHAPAMPAYSEHQGHEFTWGDTYEWVNENYSLERTPAKLRTFFQTLAHTTGESYWSEKTPCQPDTESPFVPLQHLSHVYRTTPAQIQYIYNQSQIYINLVPNVPAEPIVVAPFYRQRRFQQAVVGVAAIGVYILYKRYVAPLFNDYLQAELGGGRRRKTNKMRKHGRKTRRKQRR